TAEVADGHVTDREEREESEPAVAADHGRAADDAGQSRLDRAAPVGVGVAVDPQAVEADGHQPVHELGRGLAPEAFLPVGLPALHPAVAPAEIPGLEVAPE